MSDHLRKNLHTKTHASSLTYISHENNRSRSTETIAPNSTKSYAQRLKEYLTGSGDRVAREVEPDHTENIVQDAIDKTEQSKDNVKHGGTGRSVTHKIRAIFHPTHPNHSHKYP